MKNFFFILAVLFFAGCVRIENPAVSRAAGEIREGRADCIVIKDGRVVAREKGRGLSPLLNIYLERPEVLQHAAVVDKVIGRAAAFVIIAGRADQAHGELISEDAIELLREYRIRVSGNRIVPRILNRRMDGLCPLEKSVQGIDDPVQALAALQKRIAEMQNSAGK